LPGRYAAWADVRGAVSCGILPSAVARVEEVRLWAVDWARVQRMHAVPVRGPVCAGIL
jgi:hypothetical protein